MPLNPSLNTLPLISIIIPCYNYAHFLPYTLDSVLAQTYPEWECIVVDDGSRDHTKEVVTQYIEKDKRFQYIYQQNQGQSPTRNNGIRQAQGKYIQFLDADDLLESRKLEEQVNFLERHPEVDVIYGSVRYFIQSADHEKLLFSRWGKNEPWMPQISANGERLLEKLITGNIAELGSLLFRRATVEEVGLLDTTIQGVEDWEYCIRCALAGKYFRYWDARGSHVLMRHHPESFSKNKEKMLQGAILVHRKVDRVYGHLLTDHLRKLNLQCLYGNKRVLGEYLMRKGNIWQGIQLLSQAYRYEKKLAGLGKKLVLLSYQRLRMELSKRLSLYLHA